MNKAVSPGAISASAVQVVVPALPTDGGTQLKLAEVSEVKYMKFGSIENFISSGSNRGLLP